MPRARDPRTIAAANGVGSDTAFGAVTPPLHLSTTYLFDGFEGEGRYAYSRTANPTRDQLADTLAKLEGGAGAVVTSSGMAAVDLVLSQVEPGRLVVAPHDCYGGTYRLLAARADRRQFEIAFIDQSDPAAMGEALGRGPALLLIETPSNPLMRVVDVRVLSSQAKAAGAKVAVDNTFLSPALQQPLSLGADYVIHSTTKYLNGHSDVVGGAVIAAAPADVEALAAWANMTGVTGSPFDAYMTLRGVRTLFPRIERQQQNAAAVAAFLQAHRAVSAVHYPGLASHPGHEIARSQQSGFGAMLSFDLAGGTEAVRKVVEAVQVFSLAESLGGVESLIAHPATMTHAAMSPEARAIAGIGDGLLRLSVGLESEADLLADLDQALGTLS
ncbi:cystathionine gamma-synthase [Phenylobacterium sp.]|uniref:cystathionine gamma-synthase n=1 Tax=Phenylobacterium sp. TaxID=1871053 RepID=UPI0027322A28|nr:cystathionine gamma-synthase [Phenylobacterium sp.]MDP1598785.1 cystathionine gamma-synthase [Phenylobacterium sp.]MDP3595215.1 cystathionine gamma-synthase [Phenylobacterium sp.]